MKDIIGFFLVLTGIVIGFYVGIWVCFIGGIVEIINSAKEVPVYALGIAVGIVKVIVSGIIVKVSFLMSVLVASVFLKN